MDKEKAIELVKKVLAKTENNNSEHEVEVAMLKAQELLVKFGLSIGDVAIDEKDNVRKKEVSDTSFYSAKRLQWWEKQLSVVIANNFRCQAITRKGVENTLCFIGIKEDVEIAMEVFNFARKSISYLSDCYIINTCNENNMTPFNKRPEHLRKFTTLKDFQKEKNSYIEGFLDGLHSKFKEQVDKNNWGLILVKDEAVIEYIDKLKLKKGRSSNYNTSKDSSHFNAGYSDGYNFEYRKDLLK